ncbi:MAG: lytic murein transglycosylase B [Epsilonproteobacteria bacterium]|nr:lytic murein transglycosylase B [Campylobacterota bacterium]
MRYIKILSLISILVLSSGCLKREQQPTSQPIVTYPTPTVGSSAPTVVTTYPPVTPTTPTAPIIEESLTTPVFSMDELYSHQLGGSYGRNAKLQQFINSMVTKYNFNRNYLYGVFSSVQRDTKSLVKYNVYGKPKAAKLSTPGEWDKYRSQFLTQSRIKKGVEFWIQNRYYLEKAAHQYGVAPEYIVGIIGVETNFGGYTGEHSVLNALTTLSIEYKKRATFFTNQLENYLLLTREQQLDPRSIKGSYAGAFGLAQFMPDSVRDYAVDHDDSGQINLFTRADAIGSVANFFVQKGKWNPRIPVTIPTSYRKARFTGLSTGYKTSYTQSHMRSLGMTPASNLYGYTGNVSLIKLNRYNKDEMWWGTPNFYAIARYNPRDHYVMAVHQLAQAIRMAYWKIRR